MSRIILNACLCLAMVCGLVTAPCRAESLLKSVPPGSWGGNHIRMDVTAAGATVEYDCAVGTIDEPLLLDKDGNFEVRGKHMFERGGPLRLGDASPKHHPAIFHGWSDGSQMRLTVKLSDSGEAVGAFSLGLDQQPHLEKCL